MDIIELVKGTASKEYLNKESFLKRFDSAQHDIEKLIGASIGLSGEVGEFNEIIKKHIFQGKSIDETHLKKELGDIYWYFALACIALNTTPYEIQEIVSEKLLARYKNGFTVAESQNRKESDV